MDKKNIDWANLGFGYVQTDKRFVANYKDGAWDEGTLTEDPNVVLNECAGVLQYAQTVFEGMKAYRTEDGRVVCFRPDLNASRMADSARRLICGNIQCQHPTVTIIFSPDSSILRHCIRRSICLYHFWNKADHTHNHCSYNYCNYPSL